MIRVEDVPPEIMLAANKARYIIPSGISEADLAVWCSPGAQIVAAYAIMAEREACAEIADRERSNPFNDAGRHLAGRIAAAIRNRGLPTPPAEV